MPSLSNLFRAWFRETSCEEALSLVDGQLAQAEVQGLEGRELLTNSPYLVKDINATPDPRGSNPGHPVEVNGTLYFIAATATTGNELWKSDGTAAGTVLVKEIVAGSAATSYYSYYPSNAKLTNVNGTLFFHVNGG